MVVFSRMRKREIARRHRMALLAHAAPEGTEGGAAALNAVNHLITQVAITQLDWTHNGVRASRLPHNFEYRLRADPEK